MTRTTLEMSTKVAPWNVASSELMVMLIALKAFTKHWAHDPETRAHLDTLILRIRAELGLRGVSLDQLDGILTSDQW